MWHRNTLLRIQKKNSYVARLTINAVLGSQEQLKSSTFQKLWIVTTHFKAASDEKKRAGAMSERMRAGTVRERASIMLT